MTPDEIKRDLKTRWLGREKIACFHVVESTNSEAKRLGKKGAPEGTLVVADAQKKGRGRHGRFWESPAGTGLYLSFIMRRRCPPQDFPRMTLAVGVAVASAIEAAGARPQLKWPNDVLIAGRKVAGILTEAVFNKTRTDFAVVGVGVNVNTPSEAFPPNLRDVAGSLRMSLGRPVSRVHFLQTLLCRLEQWCELSAEEGFEKIREGWRQFDTTLGKVVEVVLPNKRFSGVAEALERDGALMVRDTNGEPIRVVAGDVVYCHLGKGSYGEA